MASSDAPAVKQPGKARNKRFVQPVVPVLPQINNSRRCHEISTQQKHVVANGVIQETSDDDSRPACPPALLNQPNGVHKDEVQDAAETGAAVAAGASAAARSLASQNAMDPSSSEPQIVHSARLGPSALASASPPPPEANETPAYQPISRPSSTHGFHFAPNLSQLRSTRLREHHIMFHAPLESPSPSRATHRSLSDPSISIPPTDLSEPQSASPAPGLGMLNGQERQTPFTAELKLQQPEPAELAERSQVPSSPDVSSIQAATQPEVVLEPAAPGPTLITAQIGDLNQSFDAFLPREDGAGMARQNTHSDNQLPALETHNSNPDSAETPAEAQNGHDEQRPRHVQRYDNGNQPNGLTRSSRASVNSFAPEYWPVPSDAEEQAVPTVSEQLSHLFISREWSDWSIEISSPVTHHDPVSYLAHGILMARSPTLRQEMQRKLFSHRLERVIVISPDWYIQPHAFEAALRYLYTESLLTAHEVNQIACPAAPEDGLPTRDYRVLIVLSYWMTGLILNLPLVVDRAVQLVRETMDWDVLELAFQQALVLENTLNPSADLLTTQPGTPGSSEAATASAASLRNIPRSPFSPSDHFLPTAYLSATRNYRYPRINATMSRQIKRIVFEFISQRVDMSTFETDVPSTTSILRSYLPDIHEYSNSSRYNVNPALASIKFGNMPPAENETSPATAPWATLRSTAQVTSAILLNLKHADLRDFGLVLKATVEPADDTLCQWIQKLVEEREKRRRRVLSSRTVSDHQRLSQQQAWNVVGWEEYVDVTDDPVPQWEICQKWTGFTLPARR